MLTTEGVEFCLFGWLVGFGFSFGFFDTSFLFCRVGYGG